MDSMPPTDGGGCRPPGEKPEPNAHVQTKRGGADPRTSIEDYSRVMLEYTHSRMATFADTDDDKSSFRSRSSRSSETSGKSGDSASSSFSQGSGAPSAGVSAHDFAASNAKPSREPNNTRSLY
ncbi:hypothetical protein FE257_010296 [Aspergillus nanangensis]|uniref:Uncharacterized protein n=1 Tax=Aspergillus nanangensis TaxID=2582783 RepID=A0AAD4CIR2_ASPNN|nr:hypothetical protein FE257_010296 [Aspergillus nanangensis]